MAPCVPALIALIGDARNRVVKGITVLGGQGAVQALMN